MEMLHVHDTWLAALGPPTADDFKATEGTQEHQLEEGPPNKFRGGSKATNFASGVHGSNSDYNFFDVGSFWKVLLEGQNPAVVKGVSLQNPVFVTMDKEMKFLDVPPHQVGSDEDGYAIPDTTAHQRSGDHFKLALTPSRYAVKGTFLLWGKIPAKMVTLLDKFGEGIYEIVQPLSADISIETILMGVEQYGIKQKNAVLTFHSKKKGSEEPGLYLSCELSLTGQLRDCGDYLTDVFGEHYRSIKVTGQLAKERDWGTAPAPTKFQLRAQLIELNNTKFQGILLTDVVVDVAGTRTSDGYHFGSCWSDWGGELTVPGSSVPLRFQCSFETGLHASCEVWKDVLGLRGLNLENFCFNSSYSKKNLATLPPLKIDKFLRIGSSEHFSVRGDYDSGGNWHIYGYPYSDASLTLLEKYYMDLFGTPLNDIGSTHQLEFGDLLVHVRHDSKAAYKNGCTTLTFESSVCLNGYKSANATTTLSSLGLEINGNVGDIKMEGFTIEQAAIDVLIHPAEKNSGRPYRASINGIVTIESVKITVGLYMDSLGKEPVWTVYGEIGNLKLSRFGSAIEGTFLDLELMKVALIASNRDQPKEEVTKETDSGHNQFNYPVKKGLQVWAKVATVDVVNKVTRMDPAELELCLVYEVGKSVTVDIVLPTKRTFNFSKRIYSGDITLEAVISDNPHISITAALFVLVHTQPDPLELDFTLAAYLLRAAGEASMRGVWTDPFGISSKVQVEDLRFEVDIDYETGLPSHIAFGGNLKMGRAKGKLLLIADEIPSKETVLVDIRDLDLGDLLQFAIDVTQKDIPEIPYEGVLLLRTVKIQYAMGNVTVGRKQYAQGLDLDCDVVILGHNMKVTANIHKEDGISIKGFIQSFHLGPLQLTGCKGTDAALTMTINKNKQEVFIDGAVTLFNELSASTTVDIQVKTYPVLHFSMKISFLECLFDLEAHTVDIGYDFRNPETADFNLSADFQEEILNLVARRAEEYFKTFEKNADADIKQMEEDLAKKEKEAQENLNNALAKLEDAKPIWAKKQKEVMDVFDKKRQEVDDKLEALRGKLEEAHIAFNKVVEAAERVLVSANQDLATVINVAESAIKSAAQVADNLLEAASKVIRDARRELESAFGDVNSALKTADNDVAYAIGLVNQKQRENDEKNREIDNANVFEKCSLYFQLAILTGEKWLLQAAHDIAQGTLNAVHAVLENYVYKSLRKALDEAEDALKETERKINDGAKKLNDKLDTVKKGGDIIVGKATAALEHEIKDGAAAELFHKADEAVRTFVDGIDELMKDVQALVNDLVNTVEWLGFETAELAVTGYNKLVHIDLPLERAALEAAEELIHEVCHILTWLADQGKKVLNPENVKIRGTLKELLKHKAPLTAEIRATVGGKECTLCVNFPVFILSKSDAEKEFLTNLMEEVKKRLVDLFHG